MTSEHFKDSELACRCCGKNECTAELLAGLERLRALIKRPIGITSGYRCLEYNLAVGGAHNSQHTLGKAADIRVSGLEPRELARLAACVKAFKGVGRNDFEKFVHVDVRSAARIQQWCYSRDGVQITWTA